jgi:hypothetical protein
MRMAKDILRVLNMPCREHTTLFSRQLDAPLSRGEAVGLRIHIVYCRGCRRFRAHLRHLRALGRTLADAAGREPGLPTDARERLNALIARAAKKN